MAKKPRAIAASAAARPPARGRMAARRWPPTPTCAAVDGGPRSDPFADTDRDWSRSEVIEVREPTASTWFDELDLGPAGAAAAGER